jgi:hypothetical protein
MTDKTKTDTRRIPGAHESHNELDDELGGGGEPRRAQILERGNVLVQRTRKMNEEEVAGTYKTKKAARAKMAREAIKCRQFDQSQSILRFNSSARARACSTSFLYTAV